MLSRKKKKLKLLVVTSTFPRWEDDTDPPFVYELASRLVDTCDIIVHTPHYYKARTREVMSGMQVHRFRYFFSYFEKLAGSTGILPSLKNNRLYFGLVPFLIVAQFFSLLFLVFKKRPDVIHAHWIIPQGFIAVVVKLLTGVPVVVTAHGADVFGLQGALMLRIKRFTLRKATACTTVSRALADIVAGLKCSTLRLEIISMGVDSKQFSPHRRNDCIKDRYQITGPFLLYVGRLTEKKGVSYLIDAMQLITREIPATKLLIIGSGELEQRLKEQVTVLDLNEHVLFAGSLPNKELPEYYATSDIFIGPAIEARSGDSEGFGLTFVEAAMSGCLLIGSDIGGIRDVITDHVTGVLVNEKSSKSIATAVLDGLQNPKEMANVRNKSREFCVRNFDWEIISKKYCKLLDSSVT